MNASDNSSTQVLVESQVVSLDADGRDVAYNQVFSEVQIPRGSPQNVNHRTITVYLPENSTIINIQAFMRNEPWGGAQNPPKPNTDDMGTTYYIESPMGGGDSPIAWAKVGAPVVTSLPNGRTEVSAVFSNWVGRNDRTGKLLVSYQRG